MNLNVLQKISKSNVNMNPYPYVVIEDALPEKIYNELESSFPEQLLAGDSSHIVNDRGHTRRYLSSRVLEDKKVSNIWLDFFAYHVSNEFYQHTVKNVLVDAIKEYYPDQADAIINTPSQPRQHVGQTENRTPIVTDCQFVMNNPLSESETSRTPHLDNPVEIYAALLYFKKYDDLSVGGDIQIWDSVVPRNPKIIGKREAVLDSVKYHDSCPYKPNSLILFLNCRHGVHGVGTVTNQSKVRRSINIIGEYGDGRQLFRI
jgi:hypothetical protein